MAFKDPINAPFPSSLHSIIFNDGTRKKGKIPKACLYECPRCGDPIYIVPKSSGWGYYAVSIDRRFQNKDLVPINLENYHNKWGDQANSCSYVPQTKKVARFKKIPYGLPRLVYEKPAVEYQSSSPVSKNWAYSDAYKRMKQQGHARAASKVTTYKVKEPEGDS